MAVNVYKDRVKTTTTTTGTGTLTLGSAATGFQGFSALANGDQCTFCTEDGTNWEVAEGIYTASGTTLSRVTIIASSNSGSAVSWSAGTKNVFLVLSSRDVTRRVATDEIWAAAGDVAIGTGNDAATNLNLGSVAGQALVADPNATNKVSIQYPLSLSGAFGGMPGSLASTYPRLHVTSVAGAQLATGRLYLAAIYLPKGLTVSNIIWYAGSTAGATLTNRWSAFFSSGLVKRAISADDTSASWATYAVQTFAMTTPYMTTVAGLHYVGLQVKGGTMPTLSGNQSGSVALGSAWTTNPERGLTSDTGLTDPASCPSTVGAIAVSANYAYVEVS